MRRILLLLITLMVPATGFPAQDGKKVIVKAGTSVVDYFSGADRYRYPSFVEANVLFRNGRVNKLKLNYDILFGEMVFIQDHDTLAIIKKKEIRYVALPDTFYFNDGYIELIRSETPRVGVKNIVKLNDVLKKGAYGTTARAGAVDAYDRMDRQGNAFALIPDEDLELKTVSQYYIADALGNFIEFNKKNVLQLYPEKADGIKAFIKAGRISFDSRQDMIKLAEFLHKM